MAQTPTANTTLPAVTEDAFLADRKAFWGTFTGFTTGAVIAVVVLLILMTIFLV
jgi:hypothetical protein